MAPVSSSVDTRRSKQIRRGATGHPSCRLPRDCTCETAVSPSTRDSPAQQRPGSGGQRHRGQALTASLRTRALRCDAPRVPAMCGSTDPKANAVRSSTVWFAYRNRERTTMRVLRLRIGVSLFGSLLLACEGFSWRAHHDSHQHIARAGPLSRERRRPVAPPRCDVGDIVRAKHAARTAGYLISWSDALSGRF